MGAAIELHGWAVLRDEEVFDEGIEQPVEGEFFAAIVSLGGGREDFADEGGIEIGVADGIVLGDGAAERGDIGVAEEVGAAVLDVITAVPTLPP